MTEWRAEDPVRGAVNRLLAAAVEGAERVRFSCCCHGLQDGAAVPPPGVSELVQRSRHHRGE